ncbi:MAG: V-type ATP synthase subunit I, partial [Parachlamydia sp.]|nr:V-type ATP synthase subunit I [Parachlamydia sp.]
LADGIVQKILQYKTTIDKLAEQERILTLEKSRVTVFGDFSWDYLHRFEADTHRKIQFYYAKAGFAEEQKLPDELIHVGSDHALDYFMALNKTPTQYPRMQEMLIPHPISELKKIYTETVADLHKNEQRLKTYAKYSDFLHQALITKLNGYNLHATQGQVNFEIEGNLFAIEGWVPVNKQNLIDQLVKDMHVHAEEIAIEETDVIPTYLENTGVGRMGEDLVHVYDTPSKTDKDPSLWVLIFFSLFFALIIGDAGYGMVFLFFALYAHYKFKMGKAGKRFTTFVAILGTCCVLWGVLSNAFFGMQLSMDNPLRKLSFVQWMVEKKAAYHIAEQDDTWKEWIKEFPKLESVKDPSAFLKEGVKEEKGKQSYAIYNKFSDNVMFELALFIGVVHIIISILRNLYRNLGGIGWILFIIGAYLYIPQYLHATSLIHYIFGVNKATAPTSGIYLMIAGMGFATAYAIYKHKIMGALEPMFGIQIFSDTMSYLRLYALGLSGAMLAAVINDLSSGLNIVIASIILLLGHATNILLSIMSGVIHGLRLNYLEWYHYSFEGDGKLFNPLRKLTLD